MDFLLSRPDTSHIDTLNRVDLWSPVCQSGAIFIWNVLNHIPSPHAAATPPDLRESDQNIDMTHVETIKPDKSDPVGSLTSDKKFLQNKHKNNLVGEK